MEFFRGLFVALGLSAIMAGLTVLVAYGAYEWMSR